MKKKIKLLALILIFNLVNMIIPNEIFNCKAFAVEYTRDSFFDYSPGERDNKRNPGDTDPTCPSILKAEDDEVINTTTDYSGNLVPMNIIYSYDGTSSKVAIDSNSHTIKKFNDIKEWKVSIESDYPSNSKRDVTLVPLLRISDVNAGDIIYPEYEILSEDGRPALIKYHNGISDVSDSSPVGKYHDVFSEDNDAFNGWEVTSVDVSNRSISVKPQFKINVAFEFDDDNAIADYNGIFTATDLNEQIKVSLEAEDGYKIVKCELLNDDGIVIEEAAYDSSSNSVTIPSIRELENKGIRLTDIHLKVTTELDSTIDPDQSEVETIPITIKLRNK